MHNARDNHTDESSNITMLYGATMLLYRHTDQPHKPKQQSYQNAEKKCNTKHNVCVLGHSHCRSMLLYDCCAWKCEQ